MVAMAEDYFVCLDRSLHVYQDGFPESVTSDLCKIHFKKSTPLNSYVSCRVLMTMLHKEIWSSGGCFVL